MKLALQENHLCGQSFELFLIKLNICFTNLNNFSVAKFLFFGGHMCPIFESTFYVKNRFFALKFFGRKKERLFEF